MNTKSHHQDSERPPLEGLAECVATAKSFGNHVAEWSARVKNLENTVFERSATHFSKKINEDERSATLF